MGATFVVRECVDCGEEFDCRIVAHSLQTRCGDCVRLVDGKALNADLVASAKALRDVLLVRSS